MEYEGRIIKGSGRYGFDQTFNKRDNQSMLRNRKALSQWDEKFSLGFDMHTP